MESCPSEAILGPGDENRYPCTYPKGHPPGHSWEYPNQNPPSATLLSKRPTEK